MDIKVIKKGAHRLIFELDGSLDIYTSLDLKVSLEENVNHDAADVIIDMAKLTYIDSSGISILIKSLNFVEGQKGRFFISNMRPVIEKVFQVSGLVSHFHILSTEEYSKLLNG